jgi:hypothetical protein
MLVKKSIIDRTNVTVSNDALRVDDIGLGDAIYTVIDSDLSIKVECYLTIRVAMIL